MSKPKVLEIPLSRLFLDNENPRHDPIDNEAEIISALVRKERVLGLAKDIVKHGLSPLDRIAVKGKEGVPGSFVALEGNRRLCALKLLRDPEKAPTAKLRRQFAEIADAIGRLPTKIEVVAFKDEEDARHWLEVRHQGELGGAGTRKWNAAQKARFSKNANNPNVQALRLVDYAVARGLIDAAERDAIKLTTLTRFISSPIVRDAIGLASTKDFEINVPQDQFDRAATAFLKDAIPTSDRDAPLVNSRTNAKQREQYASSLRSRGLAATTKLPTSNAPKIGAKKGKSTKHNPSPDSRAHVVPHEFKAVIRSSVLKRLFDELRTIDPKHHSFAAAYLLRAFTEKLVHQYANDNGLSTGGELHNVVARCEQHLRQNAALIASEGAPQKLERKLKPLRVMAQDKDSRVSPDTLGAWVHGGLIPTDAQLKRFWDELEGCFRWLIDGLK